MNFNHQLIIKMIKDFDKESSEKEYTDPEISWFILNEVEKLLSSPCSITVIGRRWFDRRNGNTYHSVQVLFDGVLTLEKDYEYGYDEHYVQTAFELIKDCSEAPDSEKSDYSLASYCRRLNIQLFTTVSDVARKKDL